MKHLTLFSSKQATVIGPTPPGTGVIALTLFLIISKQTSPTIFPFTLFTELKNKKFEYIDTVVAQEACLYSDKYKVAGRVDLIANYQHQLSIVDFKTSTNERKDSYNENYYIQTAAYAEMFEEMTGTPINQIVILVVTENGTVQDFVKDKDEYLPLLEETLEEWYK